MTRADGPWGSEWPSQAPVGCSRLWHCGPGQARDLPFPGELSSTPKPDNMEIPFSVPPPPLLEKSLSSRLTWLRCIIEPAPTGKAGLVVWETAQLQYKMRSNELRRCACWGYITYSEDYFYKLQMSNKFPQNSLPQNAGSLQWCCFTTATSSLVSTAK